jgi:hypothetical protein
MPRLKRMFEGEELGRRETEGLRNLRVWRSWELGRSRCPYCIDLSEADARSICDCWYWDG